MAGLNCGETSAAALPILLGAVDVAIAIDDCWLESATRLLADEGLVVGESGAAGLAGLLAAGDELGLASDDVVLLFLTEGPTGVTPQ
jgi:diaminopropionate ammonia-lyase